MKYHKSFLLLFLQENVTACLKHRIPTQKLCQHKMHYNNVQVFKQETLSEGIFLAVIKIMFVVDFNFGEV